MRALNQGLRVRVITEEDHRQRVGDGSSVMTEIVSDSVLLREACADLIS